MAAISVEWPTNAEIIANHAGRLRTRKSRLLLVDVLFQFLSPNHTDITNHLGLKVYKWNRMRNVWEAQRCKSSEWLLLFSQLGHNRPIATCPPLGCLNDKLEAPGIRLHLNCHIDQKGKKKKTKSHQLG